MGSAWVTADVYGPANPLIERHIFSRLFEDSSVLLWIIVHVFQKQTRIVRESGYSLAGVFFML